MSNVFRRSSLSSSSEKLLTLIFPWLRIHQLEEMFLPLSSLEICYCNVEQTNMRSFSLERFISQFKHIVGCKYKIFWQTSSLLRKNEISVPYSLVHSTQIFFEFTNNLSRNLPRGYHQQNGLQHKQFQVLLEEQLSLTFHQETTLKFQVILALLLHIAKLPERNYIVRSRRACQIMPSHTRETNTKLLRVFPTILLRSFKQPDR